MTRAAGDRRLVMDAIGFAVAEILPPEYRGAYQDVENYPDLKRVLDDARDTA